MASEIESDDLRTKEKMKQVYGFWYSVRET